MKNFYVILYGNNLEYLEKGVQYSNNNILSGRITGMKYLPILFLKKERIYIKIIYIKIQLDNSTYVPCTYIHLKEGEWNDLEIKEVKNKFSKNENKFHNLKYFIHEKDYKTFEKRIIKYVKEEDEFKLEKFVLRGIENLLKETLWNTDLLFPISDF